MPSKTKASSAPGGSQQQLNMTSFIQGDEQSAEMRAYLAIEERPGPALAGVWALVSLGQALDIEEAQECVSQVVHGVKYLTSVGGHFKHVTTAPKSAAGVGTGQCLDRGIHAMLAVYRHRAIWGGLEERNTYGSAALLVAAALLVDWAKNQREVAPSIPSMAECEDGLLQTLADCLQSPPEDGEPSGIWEAAVHASGHTSQEATRDADIDRALYNKLLPAMARAVSWAEVPPYYRLAEKRCWDVVQHLVQGLLVFMHHPHASGSWKGHDLEQKLIRSLGVVPGVGQAVSSLALQLSRLHLGLVTGALPQGACSTAEASNLLIACLMAIECWLATKGEEHVTAFLEYGVLTILNVVEAFSKCTGTPCLGGHSPRVLLIALRTLNSMLKDSDVGLCTEVRKVLHADCGVAKMLSALAPMQHAGAVCVDDSSARLDSMLHLLAALEGAVRNDRDNLASFLGAGGMTTVLGLAILDMSLKLEAAIKKRDGRLRRGQRFATALRSALSVAATAAACAVELSRAPEEREYAKAKMAEAVAQVLGCGGLVRLLLWDPSPADSAREGEFLEEAPTAYPLHDTTLRLLFLLSGLGPLDSMLELAGQQHLLEALLRVGRSSLIMVGCTGNAWDKSLSPLLGTLRLLAQRGLTAGSGAEGAGAGTRTVKAGPGAAGAAAGMAAVSTAGAGARSRGRSGASSGGGRDNSTLWAFFSERATLGFLSDALLAAAAHVRQAPVLADQAACDAYLNRDHGPECFRDRAVKAVLTAGCELLTDLTSQSGPAGEALCAAATMHCLDPMCQSLLREPEAPGAFWDGFVSPLLGLSQRVHARMDSLRVWEQEQRRAKEEEAARAAAELLALEEEKSVALAAQEKKRGKKKKKKGAKKGSEKGFRAAVGGEAAALGAVAENVASEGGAAAEAGGAEGEGEGHAEGLPEWVGDGSRGAKQAQLASLQLPDSCLFSRAGHTQDEEANGPKGGGPEGSSPGGPPHDGTLARSWGGTRAQERAPSWLSSEISSAAGAGNHAAPLQQQHQQGQQKKQHEQALPNPASTEDQELRDLMSHLLAGITLSPRSVPALAPTPLPALPAVALPVPEPAGTLGDSSSRDMVLGSGVAASQLAAVRHLLTCPLTQQPLSDPVILEDGLSYERAVVAGRPEFEVQRPNFALRQLLESLGLS